MFVYSSKILAFIAEIKRLSIKVLTSEIGLKVFNDRFYSVCETASFPISVKIFNHRSELAYFDADFYQLGFHMQLMHVNKDQLLNIIRHEIAHYLMFVDYGPIDSAHDTLFRNFCRTMGWGKEVYDATMKVEMKELGLNVENQILRKVKKLLALTSSSSASEAEQAMLKSQQLLLKHHLSTENLTDDAEQWFVKRVMKQKRADAKMQAISNILETFLVSAVYTRAAGFIYLEILGSAVNIEIAEYVAEILQVQFEVLWKQSKKQHAHLKGAVAKNSFFRGIAKGYLKKVKALMNSDQSQTKSLMVIENQLQLAQEMVYPHLRKSTSRVRSCQHAATVGEAVGNNLQIHAAVSHKGGSKIEQIEY